MAKQESLLGRIYEILADHSKYLYTKDLFTEESIDGYLLDCGLVDLAIEIKKVIGDYDPYGEGDFLADEARNAEISKMI